MDSNSPRNKGSHNFNSLNASSESLGLLSLDDLASEFSIEPCVPSTLSLQQRQENLIRNRALLDMFKAKFECPEKNESTVNESDLLRDSPMQHSKKKNTISTESDLLQHHSKIGGNLNRSTRNEQMSDNISELIHRFQTNPEASINELLCDFSFQQTQENEVGIDSGMFLTSELAQQQIDADEEEAKEKNAWIPSRSRRQSLLSLHHSFDDKMSIGDFFQQKSEQCSSIFDKYSSTKSQMIPLVNSTSIEEDAEGSADKTAGSILSLSGIKNVIAGCDSPSKIVERMLQGNTSKLNKNNLSVYFMNSRLSLDSPRTKSFKTEKPYSSSIDLRTPDLNLVGNKENQLPFIEKNRTLSSGRSTSSLDSLPHSINKLSSTKCELIWGCVKEGKSDVQSVTIRNTNKRRIKYMYQSSNPAFKVLNIDSQSSDKGIFYLHPMETRELRISFCPNVIGPQVGQLCFAPIIHKQEQTANRSKIPLFGYGGHVNIAIKGQTKDLSGKLWISLGCVDGRQELVTEFVVTNTGVIDGFVSFSLNSKALCAFQDIHISPSSAIIKRRTEQLVLVRFRPSKSDLHILNTALSTKSSKSTEIVAIRMISGAEINRQRFIKLYKRFPNELHSREDIAVLQELSVQFHGERENNEVRLFKESCKSSKNSKIIQYLHSTDISLLVDKDMDSTLLPEIDESTIAFNTMIDANEAASVLECEKRCEKSTYFNVEPPKIILTPPAKCVDSLFLTSHYPRPVHFSINASNQSIMQIRPSQGCIEPGKTIIVSVVCIASKSKSREDVNIFIEIEDDVLTSVITIWPM